MIKNNLPSYIFIRISILLLRSVAPLSILYCVVRLLGFSFLPYPLEAIVLAETLFYLIVFLPWRSSFDKSEPTVTFRTLEERKALFNKLWSNIPDLEVFLSTWFKRAAIDDIRRDDLKDFLAWSLLYKRKATLEDNEELEEYVLKIESTLGRQFPRGAGPCKPSRVSIDPLSIQHKCLMFYIVSA
jgi:hypothetical protein